MRTRIVKIGNSQGVRIPKALLEQSGLSGDVDIVVRGRSLVIAPARRARAGWADAFREMAACGDDAPLDGDVVTMQDVDEETWEWT